MLVLVPKFFNAPDVSQQNLQKGAVPLIDVSLAQSHAVIEPCHFRLEPFSGQSTNKPPEQLN